MNETWMPGSKTELMSAIEHEWNALIALADSLTDEQMKTPDSGGWSPKDNLAHITEWIHILLGYHMAGKPAHEVIGVSEDVVKGWDMEVINPVLFERNKNRSRSEVMDLLKAAYAQMTKRLNAAPFEDLLKPRHANDPQKRPVLLWVMGDTAEHFQEHRETIEKGIKKQS